MVDQVQKKRPKISGLLWHRHQYYSFFVPNNWFKSAWEDECGVIYSPDPSDAYTLFAADLKDLGTLVTPDDLEALAEGYFDSVEQLSDVDIQHRKLKASGRRLEIEAKYTFSEQGEVRQRWTRLLYHETRQIALTAQAASPEQYAYWLPMFYESMMTARVHSERPSLDLFS